MNTKIELVDYNNAKQGRDLVMLLDTYAQDPMGGGMPLDPEVKRNLTQCLSKVNGAFSLICYVDQQPAGLANCFQGFSTFACQPLINIHDLAVLPAYRGEGISQALLAAIECEARQRGCCKITLEVLRGNTAAKGAYTKFGFCGYQLAEETGEAMFWQKSLRSE